MIAAAMQVADDGPSSVPFRASSKLKTQKSSRSYPSQYPATMATASYRTWLLIDVNEASFPFIRTLRRSTAGHGASSPAGRSSDQLTESLENAPASISKTQSPATTTNTSAKQRTSTTDVLTQPLVAPGPSKDQDKRISLQQQQSHPPVSGTAVNGKKSGFMSRFRGTSQGTSNAGASLASSTGNNQASSTPLQPSSSWNIVDSPYLTAPTTQDMPDHTLHFAVTISSPLNSVQTIQSLLPKSDPSLSPTPDKDPLSWKEQIHSARLDANELANLVQSLQPDAIYLGANAPTKSRRPTLEALLRVCDANVKFVCVEPSAVRTFSTAEATSIFSLASTQNIAISLPVRWESLEYPSPEETLLVLETLQEARVELSSRHVAASDSDAVDPEVSLDKSFDVSISNIPTGLSGNDIAQTTVKTTALQTQVTKLQADLKLKDEQLSNLLLRQPASHTAEPATVASTTTSTVPVETAVTSSPSNTNLAAAKVLFSSANESPLRGSRSVLDAAALITSSPTGASRAKPDSTTSSPGSYGTKSGSGKVISALTLELQETKVLLDATRTALQTVKTQSATYQAQANDMRGTLSRARLETDSSIAVLARKDRQISEALERARKAEAEAKELGRAGREWGTRVRQVEEELGKERVKCGRAEQQYDTLSLEWKQARTRLIAEVKDLRHSHGEQLRTMADEYQKILQFKDRLQQEWSLPPTDGGDSVQVLGPTSLLHEIAALNGQLVQYIEKEVQPLMSRLQALEKRETADIFGKLQYVTDELTRIKTLMRKGTISTPSQIPSAPLTN